MAATRFSTVILLALVWLFGSLVVGILIADGTDSDDAPATTTAFYHETSGVRTPAAPVEGVLPIPMAQDSLSAGTMSASGTAMIQVADGMEGVTPTLLSSNDPAVASLGEHWVQDAAALRERGVWMISSASSDAMVHNPDRAHEINLQNLLGNGMVMVSEGQAMRAHGEEMIADVEGLRDEGILPGDVADELIAEAQALADAGDRLERDGEEMQQTAEDLLRSIGR